MRAGCFFWCIYIFFDTSLGNHPQITLFHSFFVGQIRSFALSSGERHNVLHQQHAFFNGLKAILDNPKEVLLDMYIYI